MLELFKPITHFIFETEGVLTDEITAVSETGNILYYSNSKDEYAIRRALAAGYKISFITAGDSAWHSKWRDTGVNLIYRANNDHEPINDNVKPLPFLKDVLYMGGDIGGYGQMQTCGLAACPANAVPEVKKIAQYISPFAGGKGCVRDVIEKVLKLNGHWPIPG